ncbi:MAG: hypothetical protein WC924_03165 [Candidatus Gracilibacteria bacterium]
MGRPTYDSATDRYWDGDRPLPRSDAEARKMGLGYDSATNSWWNGEVRVARQSDIDRYRELTRNGFVHVEEDK